MQISHNKIRNGSSLVRRVPLFIEVAVAVSDCKTDVADGGTQWQFLGQILNSEAAVGTQ